MIQLRLLLLLLYQRSWPGEGGEGREGRGNSRGNGEGREGRGKSRGYGDGWNECRGSDGKGRAERGKRYWQGYAPPGPVSPAHGVTVTLAYAFAAFLRVTSAIRSVTSGDTAAVAVRTRHHAVVNWNKGTTSKTLINVSVSG